MSASVGECKTFNYYHLFINTVSLRHVSALKVPSSGKETDTVQ